MATRKPHARKEDYRMRTHLIHGNFESKKWDYNHHVIPPVSHSTAFRLSSLHRGAQGFVQFASAEEALSGHIPIYIYDRLDEPTRGMLEENLAYAEGGEVAVTFASGMAAVSAALGVTLRQGQEVIAHQILYGCTYSLMTNWLPRLGVKVRFADFLKPESLRELVTPQTRVLYFETPLNPTMELIDIGAVRRVTDEVNARRSPEPDVAPGPCSLIHASTAASSSTATKSRSRWWPRPRRRDKQRGTFPLALPSTRIVRIVVW